MTGHADAMHAYRTTGYSQFGEDAVLAWLFNRRKNGFYVDVGCHHPFRFSNTAVLHLDHGWRGINIDVDERAIQQFQHYRPHDTNVLAAVGREVGELEVTIFEEGALNSLDPTASVNPDWAHMVRAKRMVPVRPLASVLAEHLSIGQHIDFLNVDAEGLDLAVLEGNDWQRFRPEIIAVEVHGLDLNAVAEHATYRFMREQRYRLLSHMAATSFYAWG